MMNPDHIHAIFDALEVGIEGADVTLSLDMSLDKPPMIGSLLPETVRGTVTVDGTVYTLTVEKVDDSQA